MMDVLIVLRSEATSVNDGMTNAQDAFMDEAVRNLRSVILAGEQYRQVLAQRTGLGVTETQAISYLVVHGRRGQADLAADLGITSGAATGLVDRLERQGIAQRTAHPSDRRRVTVELTDRGLAIVEQTRRWLVTALGRIAPADLGTVSEALSTIATDLRRESRALAESDTDARQLRQLLRREDRVI